MRMLIVDDEKMALEDTSAVVQSLKPEIQQICVDNYQDALKEAKQNRINVALLDIEMPGMNGLELAKSLKEIDPNMNIIFVTAYTDYALASFSIYPVGYLLKPLRLEDLGEALQHLRTPAPEKEEGLEIQCFGKFEVFYAGRPIRFEREKAKEVLAYLVDMRGGAVNTGELCAVLWEEDDRDEQKKKHYLRNLIMYLKKALKECGEEEILITRRNHFAVDRSRVKCDYFRYLDGDPEAVNCYRGEYMKQYSWAEFTLGHIERNKWL